MWVSEENEFKSKSQLDIGQFSLNKKKSEKVNAYQENYNNNNNNLTLEL